MTTPTGTPAGWYPDENGGLRYWDGAAWTDHRADSETVAEPTAAAAPAAPAPAAPAAAAPAAAVSEAEEHVSQAHSRRALREQELDAAQTTTPVYRRKPVLIGAAVVAALVVVVALVLALSGGGDDSGDDATPLARPAVTSKPLEQLIVVAPGAATIESVATTIKCGERTPALVRPQGATDASVCKVGGKDVVLIVFPSGTELGAWVAAIGEGAKVSGAPTAGATVGVLANDKKTAEAVRKALGA